MDNSRQITKEIQNFIEKKLVKRLKDDQKNLMILSEGDLQSCVYYHLRREIKKKNYENWHVLNKLYMGEKEDEKKIPDIAILYLKYDGETVYPKILLELKETIGPLTPNSKKGYKKDIEKLKKLMENEKIKQAYFLLAVLPDPRKEGTSKTPFMHSTMEIEQAISENKLPSRIKPIIINSQFDRKNRVDNSFRKKHRLLRKYREKRNSRKS
tara:strand:- start:30 stop:662 length:633 start_codon:yes stop_codon:yes gene_type:complete